MHNNIIKELPERIVNLTNLVILNVSANKLRYLPQGLGVMNRLEDLQIQKNKMRLLNAEFHSMFELQVFGCDWFNFTNPPLPVLSNQLEKSSEEFVDLDQVEILKNLSLLVSSKHSRNGKIDFLSFLSFFSQGDFSINWRDSFGRTPLHNAVMAGDVTTVDLLLQVSEQGDSTAANLDLNVLDNDFYTPLGLALREEKQRISHKLLDQNRFTLDVSTGGG